MRTDPMEQLIELAFDAAGIRHEISSARLDFYLPDYDTHIECKRFFSKRVEEQISRVDNVIMIQGIRAAQAFVKMILDRVS